jgi:DNA-binding transcriptional LysR family regulator
MDFHQVETFRAVMQARSMTIAASQLHTSQPNVSRVIARLQKETGLKLFERVGLRLVPTPEAEALLREVERAYVGLQTLRDAADTIRTLGAGGLRIAVSSALGIGLMPQALQLFRQQRPHVRVTVHTSDSPTISKWTAAGYCDFGIASFVSDPQEVDGRLLHRERAICIVPAGHRLARKRKVQAADLAGEPFISLAPSDLSRQRIDAAFDPDLRQLELETPQAATICVMVARGLGVSIVNPLVYRALDLRGVSAIPFDPAIHFDCHSLHSRDRPDQALVGDFLQAVRRVLKIQ